LFKSKVSCSFTIIALFQTPCFGCNINQSTSVRLHSRMGRKHVRQRLWQKNPRIRMQSHKTLVKRPVFSPVTVPVHCRLWNVERGRMQWIAVVSGECSV
jgi:hypothetical protein